MDRSTAHRLVDAFHRCKFRRLRLVDEARAGIARDACEHDRHGRHRHPQNKPTPVQWVVAPPQESNRVNRRDERTCHDVRRNQHVRILGWGGRVERGCERVDIEQTAVTAETEPAGRVHPRIRHHDKDGAQRATHRDGDRRQPVDDRRQPVPAVQVEAEKNRLDEEREALRRERQSEYRA